MQELKKIDLNSKSDDSSEVSPSLARNKMVKKRIKFPKKTGLIALAVVIMLVVTAIFTVVLPAQRTISSALSTYRQAKKAVDAVKQQNIELGSQELAQTKKDLLATQKNLQSMGYLNYVPIASWYYSDADHAVKAGLHGLDAATTLVDSLKPYADVLGLKGQGSFTMGSAEQRIQTAVMTMGKITPRIDAISDSVIAMRDEIDKVDPNHYPPIFGGEKIQKQIKEIQLLADEGTIFVDEAKPLVKVLPALLGEKSAKRYLILFQNDKELRPTGGFITAYSIFRVDKGVISVERSSDIYDLDNALRNKPKAPEPILKYFPKVTSLNMRDSNLSPDFVTSMDTFMEMYNKVPGVSQVDGVIALDTHVLVSVLKILDDKVEAGGLTFTTQIDKRCDCPQIIYSLEDNISRPVNYVKTGRKDLLGAILYALMQKALKSSPKLYWGPLFQDMISKTAEKHVLFYVFDKKAQAGIESLNAAGRIKPFEGDYLSIIESNFSGAKTNLFLKENVTQDYQFKSDGTVTKTITMVLKNPHEPSDCNLERGGLCLNALHRDWLRIYVPKGSKMIDSQGSEVKMTTYDELGKTVFDGFITVRPLGQTKFTITYTLPFKVKPGSTLPLLIQNQPGTYGYEYDIKVNGKTTEKFNLLTDKEIKIKS